MQPASVQAVSFPAQKINISESYISGDKFQIKCFHVKDRRHFCDEFSEYNEFKWTRCISTISTEIGGPDQHIIIQTRTSMK